MSHIETVWCASNGVKPRNSTWRNVLIDSREKLARRQPLQVSAGAETPAYHSVAVDQESRRRIGLDIVGTDRVRVQHFECVGQFLVRIGDDDKVWIV